jgi:hypothetical protein
MPNTCICAPARARKAVVVGVKACQFNALTLKLRGYPIEIREVSPEKFLHLRRVDDLVVLTKFVNHKHTCHARRIALDVIRVEHGAASAVAHAIIAFFGLDAT